VRETADALAVPSIALIPEQGGRRVYVVEDGVARARSVQTGLRTETQVEITRGLDAGEQVIVSGLQMVQPGMPVQVKSRGDRESSR
jgi:membrane fusion protein (multidrug efflux system)